MRPEARATGIVRCFVMRCVGCQCRTHARALAIEMELPVRTVLPV